MHLRLSSDTTSRALRTSRSAFTLLEVLVVVAIIVMLAGVGGFYMLQRYQEAQVSRAKIDVHRLSEQLDTFALNNGSYPGSIEGLAEHQPNGGGPLSDRNALVDPWGKPYQFEQPDQQTTFKAHVFTTSPRGVIISSQQAAK